MYNIYQLVDQESIDTIRKLLDIGEIDPKKKHGNNGPLLHYAILKNKINLVNVLLEHYKNKIDLDEVDEFGLTPLVIATLEENLEIMEQLLKHGALPNNGKDGISPLHIAVQKANMKAIELLHRYGADLHLKTNLGRTLLHSSAERLREHIPDWGIVKYLLQQDIDPNIKDKLNKTAKARFCTVGGDGSFGSEFDKVVSEVSVSKRPRLS